ncbi:hypothetical protein C1H46_000851 [Malus baccata]|uniref:Sugar phosphate transporter domain-containing protein n=1 Tax=Malus baccata TaxID=106549 RepID=A0A540NSI1_MALBA|nr:hypothetical protein C1H46_000851 [Malus baccata]
MEYSISSQKLESLNFHVSIDASLQRPPSSSSVTVWQFALFHLLFKLKKKKEKKFELPLCRTRINGGRVEMRHGGGKRFVFAMSSFDKNETDLEGGKLQKDGDKSTRGNKVVKIQNKALLSGLAYCLSSCSMILVNKFVLSSYNFDAGISLMLYQNLVSVIIVSVLTFTGIISTEPLTWRLVKVWLPVNVIFVGMLITSMFSLKYINVAMVTVLKNVTNVITAVGEMYLFQKHHDSRVWAALFLMIISAISGGVTDLSFHAVGYAWQFLNCILTASYSLTLRRVMDTAKLVTKSGKLNEFSMVLLNNTLSLPLGILLIFVFNEVDYLFTTHFDSLMCGRIIKELLLYETTFEVSNLLVGDDFKWIFGPCNQLHVYVVSSSNRCHHIQFLWLASRLSTPVILVGSLNKIPLSVAGILLFKVPTSLENSASIFFGLVAGVFFARAKMRERS